MTLTTERQQFEEWFTNKYPRSHWGIKKTASGEYQGGLTTQLWEVWKESRGCMANREAQPVALVDRRPAASGSICWQNGGKDLPHGTELYTAPLAPAVPDDYQHLKNVQELYHKQEDRLFALAQRIKGAAFDKYSHSTAQAIDVLERANFGEDGDACRAAMLAAAPEGGNG
ncbi:hypothetical protein I5Q20_00390 [Serratia marcescens]|nr:hypothetical protein [Serratia marcescens]